MAGRGLGTNLLVAQALVVMKDTDKNLLQRVGVGGKDSLYLIMIERKLKLEV